MKKLRLVLAVAVAVQVLAATIALAHPDPDDGVLSPLDAIHGDHQHGGEGGHLPPVRRNVRLVGKLDLFGTGEQPARISDVGVWGNYAYLGAFYEPNCEEGGVYIIDISKPRRPTEAGFIPTTPGAYVGEGVQVIKLDTPEFEGRVLLHNNENCVPGASGTGGLVGRGGTSLWDVTNPRVPEPLAQHVGDNDPAADSQPHSSHSVFGWQQGDKAYMAQVDNAELAATDIDIFDITDPTSPELVAETGMTDFPQIAESPPPNGATYLNHDMVVEKVGRDRYWMLSNYWDGGYVILDVSGLPKGEDPKFLRDTDFGREPFIRRTALPPGSRAEGNAHQGEFNFNDSLFLGADEDFGPFRNLGEILSGPYEGQGYSATVGNLVPGIPQEGIESHTQYVGKACAPLVPATDDATIALIERGICTFTIKAQFVQAAGYEAGLVFSDQAAGGQPPVDPAVGECEGHVFMLAVGDVPFLFISRSAGLKLLEQRPFVDGDPCKTPTNEARLGGTPEAKTRLDQFFDGWGYLHLFDSRTMEELDAWALPESLRPRYARGKGDLSIHEVATDPRRNLAYSSHYAGGFRVFRFSRARGIREVGAYIAPSGNNFWGVEIVPGTGRRRPLVAASDRDSGLWLFRYTGRLP